MREDPIPRLKQELGEILRGAMNGWTVSLLASRLRTDAPRISELRRGRLDRFSAEQLIRFLDRMDYAVAVRAEPRRLARMKDAAAGLAERRRQAPEAEA